MKLNNNQIYTLAQLANHVTFDEDIYIPVKANFYIQKNLNTVVTAAADIDKARLQIAKHYGEPMENEEQYKIPEENQAVVEKELNELFSIEQELDIKTISIDDLKDIKLTAAQMNVLMFMIED